MKVRARGGIRELAAAVTLSSLIGSVSCSLVRNFPPSVVCKELRAEALQSIPGFEVPLVKAEEKKGFIAAGVGKVDISPPPGFPFGGSGFAATYARGYWGRLYARAFFFRDADGESLALVSCDLFSIPGGLQAKVAWLLRDNGLNLTRENLILAATHTHQGPGNYLSAKVFNDQASPEPGYDPELFEFLASRIADAVRLAGDDAKSGQATLVVRKGSASELLRNRAPAPFMLNPEAVQIASGPPIPACPEPYAAKGCPRYRAIDGDFLVLEIQREMKPVGVLLFLSVHPEVMGSSTAAYQSDFTGWAMQYLEKRSGNPPNLVAGFFNGADGDTSARWDESRRNRNATIEMALKLVTEIDAAPTVGTIDSKSRFLVSRRDLLANPYRAPSPWECRPRYCVGEGKLSEGSCKADKRSPKCLAGRPIFGVATAGGGEDARTALYALGWREGWRKPPQARQGMKVGAFESRILLGLDITRLVAPSCFYPQGFPLSLVSVVGPTGASQLAFAVLPAELTFLAWRRTRLELEGAGLSNVVPIGPANDYINYVTTREEYAAQFYEGASDIFGPYTAEVIQDVLVGRIFNLHPPVGLKPARVEKARYYPGFQGDERSFGPHSLGEAHTDPDDGLENLTLDGDDRPYRRWPRFSWCEPDWAENWRTSRKVEIYPASSDTPFDADDAWNIVTVLINRPSGSKGNESLKMGTTIRVQTKGKRRWMAIWMPRPLPLAKFFFKVTIRLEEEKDGKKETKEVVCQSKEFLGGPMDTVLPAIDCSCDWELTE